MVKDGSFVCNLQGFYDCVLNKVLLNGFPRIAVLHQPVVMTLYIAT